MPLSDKKIGDWSQRGDAIHAWYSYRMVRDTLAAARIEGLTYTIYPQGSYANKTNIAGDSDVDMVIALSSAFYANKEKLTAPEIKEYDQHYEESDLAWQRFRKAVARVLHHNYWATEKNKCVNVRSNLIRLPADVLIALDHRYYRSFLSFSTQSFTEGVQFYTSKGTRIINYPKDHIRSCARKNQDTGGRYRPVVRVAKNARNVLMADSRTSLRAGTVPSYFLESLFWNVPDSFYSDDLPSSYRQATRWLHENLDDLKDMDFPNRMGKLFGDAQDAVWNTSNARSIITAMRDQLMP
jgi:hypothetical protein